MSLSFWWNEESIRRLPGSDTQTTYACTHIAGAYVHVRLDPSTHGLHAYGLFPGTRSASLTTVGSLEVSKDRGVWEMLSWPRDGYSICNLYRPLSTPPLPATEVSTDLVLRRLQGLWTGIYGPHGRELLHVRFIRTGSEEEKEGEVRLDF